MKILQPLIRVNFNLKALFTILLFSIVHIAAQAQSAFRIVGYIPNWTDVNAFTQSLDFKQVTHINYAFQNPNAAGDLVESNTGMTALVAKAHLNNVKVLISLGGAGSAEVPVRTYYQNLINTSVKRADFIHKLMLYLNKYKLDGLDVDEEGPAINSYYGAFIKQLSDTLKPKGKLLTAAVGWGSENIPNSCLQYFDWVNLMAYDLTGDWNLANPGQHSPYSFAQQMIKDWIKRGVKKENLCLGVPFYGYGFYKIPGSYNYNTILTKYPDAWQKDQVGDTIYYNGITTIWKKTKLALSQISGIMIWELTNDVKGDQSLLKVISTTVDSLKTSATNLMQPKGMNLYPNPAGNELVIENMLPGRNRTINVMDLRGSLVESFSSLNSETNMARINISGLSKGAYFCRISSTEGNCSKLFLKQ
jgi:chitinase